MSYPKQKNGEHKRQFWEGDLDAPKVLDRLQHATRFNPENNFHAPSTASGGVAEELSQWAEYIGSARKPDLPLALTVARASLMVRGTPAHQFNRNVGVYSGLFARYAESEPDAARQLLHDHRKGIGVLRYGNRTTVLHDASKDKGTLARKFREASQHLLDGGGVLQDAKVYPFTGHTSQRPVVGMSDRAKPAVA